MKPQKAREQVKMWRLPHLGDLELLHATYLNQSFSRHAHEGYAVGVIERGALQFFYRGANLVAPSGCVNLAVPGEAHTGHAASGAGWTYRMFYPGAGLLQQAASEIAGRPAGLPFFQAGVIHDDYLAGLIRRLHCALEKPATPVLEQESRLLWILAQWVMRHADDRPLLRKAGKEHRAVKLTREYIEAHYAEDVSLKQLARVANLSPFHLIRVFAGEVGIPPHAYLTQVRVGRARALLGRGLPIAQVALETGFADQSHLHRHFKRIVGVTPGQYSNFVQDRHI
ncbi:MAG: AraC family transcriptional regulator [Firmicutes bacterium]|nr:AraC family transcriptional regulator [Bacillota bacterium]